MAAVDYGAMHLILRNAINDDLIGASASDLATHGVDAVSQIDDFRILSSVFNNSLTFSQSRSHHDIFRRTITWTVEVNASADQFCC